MARAMWALHQGRPRIEIVLVGTSTRLASTRNLVADSGAGSLAAPFELILDERDCLLCGGWLLGAIQLRGAYVGAYSLYSVRVQIPQLGFDRNLQVVGIPSTPPGFDGLAGFRFLNRFTYGNFGDPGQFGLET